MRTLAIHQPRKLVFGVGAVAGCADDLVADRRASVFIATSPSTHALAEPILAALDRAGARVTSWLGGSEEPTIKTFRDALAAARDARPDAVVGLGGGSVVDVAKLVAALVNGEQDITETFGISKLRRRATFLACLPTTAGTGSEVSPNAILLDETDQLKKGVISPHLMPDAAYVDPALTLTVPPAVTAATGVDALTHCIEAYANRFAHPMIDIYALEGIRLISRHLVTAVEQGYDVDARTAIALGSMYGGMCLGPVNTGAVHALAYPLGGEFHIAHGVSNCRRRRSDTRMSRWRWASFIAATIWTRRDAVSTRFGNSVDGARSRRECATSVCPRGRSIAWPARR
jgi:alcohol dehydrogenase class IV